jgi:cyclopropane-fatty-acyl-phospholipid synthase
MGRALVKLPASDRDPGGWADGRADDGEGAGRVCRAISRRPSTAGRLGEGRLDFVLPDGRGFAPKARGRDRVPPRSGCMNPDVFRPAGPRGRSGLLRCLSGRLVDQPRPAGLPGPDPAPGEQPWSATAFPVLGWCAPMNGCGSGCRRTRAAGAKNIAYHYDLGNDFYRLWLDETMTYSSAIFAEPAGKPGGRAAAQIRQHGRPDGARPGEHVLEIGCGWGGFAEYAAEGARAAGHGTDDQPGAA